MILVHDTCTQIAVSNEKFIEYINANYSVENNSLKYVETCQSQRQSRVPKATQHICSLLTLIQISHSNT